MRSRRGYFPRWWGLRFRDVSSAYQGCNENGLFHGLLEIGNFVNQRLSIVRTVCAAGVNLNRVRGTIKLRDLYQSFASRSDATEIFASASGDDENASNRIGEDRTTRSAVRSSDSPVRPQHRRQQ